jgi:DNA polymerase sigma
MTISERQLETWSHQGPTSQFTATYQTLKNVLHSNSAPYASRSFDTFLQGSYANDTNIYADSDVDIVMKTDEVYYSDTSNLNPPCQ